MEETAKIVSNILPNEFRFPLQKTTKTNNFSELSAFYWIIRTLVDQKSQNLH